jgi:hypothetical protein
MYDDTVGCCKLNMLVTFLMLDKTTLKLLWKLLKGGVVSENSLVTTTLKSLDLFRPMSCQEINNPGPDTVRTFTGILPDYSCSYSGPSNHEANSPCNK